MPDMIRSGVGNCFLAGVNSENRLMAECITYSGEHHANHTNGIAFNMLFDVTPAAGGDCFLYMKNSDTKDITIEGVWIRVASAEQITMELNAIGTPLGGADVVPANLNSGVLTPALGTFLAAAAITGLSGGTVINKGWVANTATAYFNFEQDIILAPNTTFSMWVVTGAVNVAGAVVFHYHKHT